MTRRTTGIRIAARNPDKPNLYGPAATPKYGAVTHADRFGTDICLRSAAPPPVGEYDAYLKGRNIRGFDHINRTNKTGFRIRRIVIMRRAGSTWKECGEAVGISAQAAREWTEMLPLELAI